MNFMPYLNAKRSAVFLTISLVALSFLTAPHARAQDVIGVSATGGEPQSGDGATATGTLSLAGGTNATASGFGAISWGAGPSAAMAPLASGNFGVAIGSGGAIDHGAQATGPGSIAIGGVGK